MFCAVAVFPVKLEIWESYRESRSIIRRVILQASLFVWTETLKTYYYFCQYIVYCHGRKFMRGRKISFDTGLILLLDFCAVSKSRRCTDQCGFFERLVTKYYVNLQPHFWKGSYCFCWCFTEKFDLKKTPKKFLCSVFCLQQL